MLEADLKGLAIGRPVLVTVPALDETIPKEDPADMSPKDRGFGAAHKKRAYEKSKKAHERTDKFFEDNADELGN